jgi:hypothetical protein
MYYVMIRALYPCGRLAWEKSIPCADEHSVMLAMRHELAQASISGGAVVSVTVCLPYRAPLSGPDYGVPPPEEAQEAPKKGRKQQFGVPVPDSGV